MACENNEVMCVVFVCNFFCREKRVKKDVVNKESDVSSCVM